MSKADSLIFDMDGTLWDAVDSYALIWNETFRAMGIDATATRGELVHCMGMRLGDILDTIMPGNRIDRDIFLKRLATTEATMMPSLGGILYPGVADGVKTLASRYKLFMVSNCAALGIPNFLSYTGLTPYITDYISNGDNGLDKADNIKLIVSRNNLTNPVYIGDTQSDADHCASAGVEFIHAAWGFGQCNGEARSVDSFGNLVKLLTT